MVRSRKRDTKADPAPEPSGLDVNAVVSYNLRAIRERRGFTQQHVADRLARLTGHQLPQASISAMERGFDGWDTNPDGDRQRACSRDVQRALHHVHEFAGTL